MNQITNKQIRTLETEAFAAGDALMGYICRVALGNEYTEAELNDDSCLDHSERHQVAAMTEEDARKACVIALSHGNG